MIGSAVLHRIVSWLRQHAAADRNSLTITIAPAQAERTFQIDLPRWSVRLLIGILIASFGLLLAKNVLYGKLIHDTVRLRDLRKENQLLRARADRVDSLEVAIARIDRIRSQLYILAGVPDSNEEDAVSPAEDAAMSISAGWEDPGPMAENRPDAPNGPIRLIPLRGPVSRGYTSGARRTPDHPGVDIAGPEGAPVAAAGGGVVETTGWDPTYGNLLVLDHGAGWKTRYGHNHSIIVQQGDTVRSGQTVALVGNTGKSSAPHLHFEVVRDGQTIDPGGLFPAYRATDGAEGRTMEGPTTR